MKELFLVLTAMWTFVAFRAEAATPSIVAEPQGLTVNNGSAAAFTVVATNAFTYQWYFQGANILAGQTNATLNMDNIASSQAGSYTVVATSSNNISVTNTHPAVLTVVQGTVLQWTISTYPNGGTSNFLVQLFDHDKPATVENFLHYVSAGVYSNMFFDRDVTNFVLQGGDDASVDRTTNIANFNPISIPTNFPSQVANEFSFGPLVHNTFGTLAMALVSGETNSATGAFFFNLTNNSAALDNQDFTVFGRILYGTNSGSNVLQYFNGLRAPGNGIYDYSSDTPTLPVNSAGLQQPTDANLFYCDIQFVSPPPAQDTNLPTISILSPALGDVFTNADEATFTGTASDNIAVAQVYGVIFALTGLDAGQNSGTNSAVGTTNWSFDIQNLVPGVYQMTAYAQDGEGNVSLPANDYITNFAVLTLITNVDGKFTTNEQNLLAGQQYSFTAQPGPGQEFVNWQVQGVASLDPMQTITAETNLTLEVTYFTTNLPPGLAITSPVAGSIVQTTNDALTISGTIPSSVTVTNLSVQLFSQSNAVTFALKPVINGTNWSLVESNLVGGLYTVVVQAEDSLNQKGIVSENFTALVAPPIIISGPSSVTVNTGSSADFKVTASNVVSYQWELLGAGPISGATSAILALNNVSSNQSGSSYAVILTALDGETVTSAPATLTVVPGTIVKLTISAYPGGGSNEVLVELFDHDKPATVENFIHYIASGGYSNTFFDTDRGSVLIGGDYVTTDRTTNNLRIENISTGTNVFPSEINSEYGLGPQIPNAFGTLAAVSSGETGAKTSAFFFNLADNPNLDADNYTVFGRIISGTNALQYFNSLTASNGLYNDTNYNLSALPVNYSGTNAPENASVFYCDFSFETTPPVITNVPAVSITFPSPNQVFTNGGNITITGTASDNAGLADVYCVLTSLAGAYGTQSFIDPATGATNWSVNLGNLGPGIFKLTAYAQDGAGNLSAPATEYFTNLARLSIVTNLDGKLTTAPPQYLAPGQTYSATAAPAAGQQFYGWTINGGVSLNPVQTGTVAGNLTLTVEYVTTNFAAGLAITSPVSGGGAMAIQYVLTVNGSITATNVSRLTCQFYKNSNSVQSAFPAAIIGTNWSVTITNLANGPYTVVALASNATGGGSIASANFILTNFERLAINVVGKGTIVSNPGPIVVPGTYTVKATASSGQVFYSWNNGAVTTLNPTYKFQVVSNTTLTATFIAEDATLSALTVTYPAPNAMLTNRAFTITGGLPVSVTNLTYQLFVQSNGLSEAPQSITVNPSSRKWSFPVSNLNAGAYTILAAGYDANGNSRLVSRSFNVLAKLAVSVNGKGTVTPGFNGSYRQVGRSYTITATPKAGQTFAYWAGGAQNQYSATTPFVMASNTVLTANFTSNYFPAVAGTYTGLFIDPFNPAPTNSGFVTVTVTPTGAFSGNLMFPSVTYPISYLFGYTASIQLTAKNSFDSNTLDLVMNLDLTNGTETITGYLADLTAGGGVIWESSLVLNRGVTALAKSNAPAPGKYVLLEQFEDSTNAADPIGYAAVSLSSGGAIALGGALPDNTAISESAKISSNGIWPVYIVPATYKKKGFLIGWQTNTVAGTSAGELFWFKPGAAVATNLTSSGAAFVAPLANTPYRMVIGGTSSYPLPTGATVRFTSEAPLESVSLLPTGALSGFIQVNGNKLPFKGAFVSPAEGGAGFVVGTNGQFEGFQIDPPPL